MLLDEIKKLNKLDFLELLNNLDYVHDIEISYLDTNPNTEQDRLIMISEEEETEVNNRYNGSVDVSFKWRFVYNGVKVRIQGMYGSFRGYEGEYDIGDITVSISSRDPEIVTTINKRISTYIIAGNSSLEMFFDWSDEKFDINSSYQWASFEFER